MSSRAGRDGSHLTGVALVFASAAVFSLAGVLTKAIASDGWTIACWRGLVGGALIVAYSAWTGRARPASERIRLGWRGWLLATVGALSSLAFIYAFKLTYVANVAVIYATAPFMAAGLGWLAMREPVRRRTLAAAVVALMGVVVIFGGGLGTGSLTGDIVALAMAFGCALYMVLIRTFRGTDAVLANGVSALQLFAVGVFVIDPLAVPVRDIPLLATFGLTFAIASVLWVEGTRRIPASEAGLIGTAETPFAILLAWLMLAELPPTASFAGGAIVLAAVIGHALGDAAAARK